MAHHSHLRYTPAPKGLPAITTYDISGLVARFERYVVSEELSKDNIPHYHIWLEGDVCEKSIRNYVVEALRIPKLKRGQTNGYYCLKFDAYRDPNPSYVCKDGNIKMYKGYTEDEIKSFIENGNKKNAVVRQEVRPELPGAEGAGNKTLIDQFLEYMEEVLPKEKNETFSMEQLKRKNYAYWKSKNGGLFPVRSTEQRFMKSAWAQWCDIVRRSDSLAIADLEEKNLM